MSSSRFDEVVEKGCRLLKQKNNLIPDCIAVELVLSSHCYFKCFTCLFISCVGEVRKFAEYRSNKSYLYDARIFRRAFAKGKEKF